jgi:hypothetical protein
MLAKEPFGAPPVLLPALSEPGPYRPLDPELRVAHEPTEQPERTVELTLPNPVVKGVRGGATTPEVRGPRPSKELSEPSGPRRNHPSDRAGREAVRKGPSGRRVDPPVREPKRPVVVRIGVGHQELDRNRSLLERLPVPERPKKCEQPLPGSTSQANPSVTGDPTQVRGPHPKDGKRGAEVRPKEFRRYRVRDGAQCGDDAPALGGRERRHRPTRDRHQPDGASGYWRSSHWRSGSKYSRRPRASIRRSPVRASRASGHSRLWPISSIARNLRPASSEP